MKTKNPNDNLLTETQWRKQYKVPLEDAEGIRMWSNGFRQQSYLYFAPDEVREKRFLS